MSRTKCQSTARSEWAAALNEEENQEFVKLSESLANMAKRSILGTFRGTGTCEFHLYFNLSTRGTKIDIEGSR